MLARDFDEALPENEYVCGVFDPTIVQYPDENGNITSTRMYMTGDIWDSTGTWQDGSEEGNCASVEPCSHDMKYHDCISRQAIISAVSTN